MIQLVFDSVAKITPEWENEQDRLIFRLVLASVSRSKMLHERMDALGATELEAEAIGMVAVHYDGDIAHRARVTLELPDGVWDHLANQADDLLEASREES